MCRHWDFFCFQVDGNLGMCSLTADWCKNSRGWFPENKVWCECRWYLRIYLYIKHKIKRFKMWAILKRES